MSQQPGLVHDGMYRVSWVDAIADINAPTTTELDAGISLECQITPDGLGREASDESVDTSRLCSVFSTMQVGRTSFETSVTLVRLDEANMTPPATEDEAYRTLVKGKRGFLVVRDNLAAETAWTAAQDCEVYPVQCGTRSKATPAANEQQTFTLPLMVTSDPALYAVVATGV